MYLHEALDRRLRGGGPITEDDVREATIAGSVLRLRPKLMTVSVVMASLVPNVWSTGVGSDVMKPIAAPIIGGMVTSTIHVLIITPIIFYIMKRRALRKGTLTESGFGEGLTQLEAGDKRAGEATDLFGLPVERFLCSGYNGEKAVASRLTGIVLGAQSLAIGASPSRGRCLGDPSVHVVAVAKGKRSKRTPSSTH